MTDLFKIAECLGTTVYYGDIPHSKSMSVPDNICLDYSFARGGAEADTRLIHELGHCATGAFYNQHSPLDIVERQEWKADKWAVHRFLPIEDILSAIKEGIDTTYELADRLNVTEEYLIRALEVYVCEELL